MDRQKLADEWDDGISPAVAGLAGLAEPYGVALDYSAQSLRALEHVITTLFHQPEDLFTDDDRPVIRALTAYIGLTLTHLTAGHWDWDNQPGFAEHAQPTLTDTALLERITTTYWGWDDNPAGTPAGLPIAVPGDGLELHPVSPLHLLFATVIDRPTNPGPLAQTFTTWSEKVTTPPPPGVVGIDLLPSPEPSPVLDDWLAARQRDFPQWATRYPGNWDFTPESIDRLTDLIHHHTPTVEAINDPANTDLLAGACWYLGEMLRRSRPSRWVYVDYTRDPGDPALVEYEVQSNDDRDVTGPFRLFRLGITKGQPKARGYYDRWAARSN